MRREVVRDLRLRQPGFAVNAETGLQPILLGYTVKPVPISWINRSPGMGNSSFRLVRVGGGYWDVLFGMWLYQVFGRGPYRDLRRGSAAARRRRRTQSSVSQKFNEQSTASNPLLLLGVFAAMAILQISFAGRQCLWVDEVFSLAIATGHSLEHPANIADAAKGDFIEPDSGRSQQENYKSIWHMRALRLRPARIIRAILLSDTSPPLYYLLLYVWTLIVGTSDIALRLFSITCYLAAFPILAAVARRTRGRTQRATRLCSFRILADGTLLLRRRQNVFSSVTFDNRHGMDFFGIARKRNKHRTFRALDCLFRRWFSHPLLLCTTLACAWCSFFSSVPVSSIGGACSSACAFVGLAAAALVCYGGSCFWPLASDTRLAEFASHRLQPLSRHPEPDRSILFRGRDRLCSVSPLVVVLVAFLVHVDRRNNGLAFALARI